MSNIVEQTDVEIASQVQSEKIKYCLYARKSTEQEDKQALSIESQVKEMLALAEREGLEIVEIKRESHSSKSVGKRPIYNELIKEIKEEKFNGILTWAPDRLSRNAGDLGAVVDLMDQKLLKVIRTYSQTFTNNPNEKFLLMILGSQAKLENDNKMVNVKRGLRARCEMGLWPSVPPTGYLPNPDRNKKCEVVVDELRASTIKQIYEKVAHNGWSGRKVFHWLRDELDFRTKNGKHLTLSNVYIILKNTFYYGEFEYPKGSGNWYTGKHKALITKELYDLVQEQVKSNILRVENKEFAFTKLMTCRLCGSGISADEKFKKLKNGSINRHVYYGCTKSKNRNCKGGYINEKDLIKQFQKLIQDIDISEKGMKNKIKEEVSRIKKFNQSLLGIEQEIKVSSIDIQNYAKFLLKEGSIDEKRELLGCLKGQIVLEDKKLELVK